MSGGCTAPRASCCSRLRRSGSCGDGGPAADAATARGSSRGLALQAAIGYTQYFTGVPVLLVGFHIAGAVCVWTATVNFYLGLFTRPAEVVAGPEPAGGSQRQPLTPTPTPA